MTNEDAKFILRAYRPDGSDAADPMFAEALVHARTDPVLGAWLQREQALDAGVAAKLREVPVPAGLRASILAGAQVSAAPRRRTAFPGWVWAAAALFVVTAIGGWLVVGRSGDRLNAAEIARLAMADVEGPHTGARHDSTPGSLAAWLSAPGHRVSAFPADAERLRREGCRVVRLAGRDVFEICFERSGGFHLYVMPRKGLRIQSEDLSPVFRAEGQLASVTWGDARFAYVLVSETGLDALRRVL